MDKKKDIQQDIRAEYSNYVMALMHFALSSFSFKSVDGTLLSGGFLSGIYSFNKWDCELEPFYIDSLGVRATKLIFKWREDYKVAVNLSGAEEVHLPLVTISNNTLHFSEIPSEQEITDLCTALFPNKQKKDSIAAGKRSGLKQTLLQYFMGKEGISTSVLFVPVPVAVMPLEEQFDLALASLKAHVAPLLDSKIDRCYFIIPERPSDSEDLSKKEWSNKMIQYADMVGKKRYGLIPITISDIDSYRRLTKVFLREMIIVDRDHKLCPICGNEMIQDSDGAFRCYYCDPGLSIVKHRCSNANCRKYYLRTSYKSPHIFTAESINDIGSNKYELQEIAAGFKNIVELQPNGSPRCPYCGS